MLRSALLFPVLFASTLFAQTVESVPFRAVVSSANELQPPADAVSGNVTIWFHLVRDSNGDLTSGSVDASVGYNFSTPSTVTAMHIHRGGPDVNGPIVVPFAVSRTDVTATGSLPAQQTDFPSATVPLDVVKAILQDPGQFYFNIHSTVAPGGVMRGQLQRAQVVVLTGQMIPENETPPHGGQTWSGTAAVMLLVSNDAYEQPTSAYATFNVQYNGFPAGTNFTGLHIHSGASQAPGPITINSGLAGSVPANSSGSGLLRYGKEVDLTAPGAFETVMGLSRNPGRYYINLHTSAAPGGAIRGQLMSTDQMSFQVPMTPEQEVPPSGANATAPSKITLYTSRNPDATAAAGLVVFDLNPRFPAGTQFTGLHIHEAPAGTNAPVVIDSMLQSEPILVGDDGFGNIYRAVSVAGTAGTGVLTSIAATPWKFYENIHTPANPGGAVRGQLSTGATLLPSITFVRTSVPYSIIAAVAPGSQFVITGENLAPVATDLAGFNNLQSWPTTLNGTSVTIGGAAVPLSAVSPTEIRGQVPFSVTLGIQPVVVTTSTGTSKAFMTTVVPAAPAIQLMRSGLAAARDSDGAPITAANPAMPQDVIVVFATGLGQTNPPLQSGAIVPPTVLFSASTLSARIGGINTTVISAVAEPGMPGIYRVRIVVPNGISQSGNAPMLLQIGLVTSNVVALPVVGP